MAPPRDLHGAADSKVVGLAAATGEDNLLGCGAEKAGDLCPGSFKGGFQRVDFSISDAEKERYQNLQTLIAMIPKDAS